MAVKIFCNQCQKFIRDAKGNEMSKLTGEEICVPCREFNRRTFDEVEKARDAAIDQIKKLAAAHLVKLDNTLRKAIRGEGE